jgi:predicted nucleotidyltransferase
MRLTEAQRTTILAEVESLLGKDTLLWLFGSRVDDAARGGDIDLYAEVAGDVPVQVEARLVARLEHKLDNHVDLVIRHPHSPESPLFNIARMTGVRLNAARKTGSSPSGREQRLVFRRRQGRPPVAPTHPDQD